MKRAPCGGRKFFSRGRVFCGARVIRGDFWKSPLELPQNSPTKRIATHGRKGEQRAAFFYAFKGSFRSPFVQYRLRFLPLPLVDFFEASPYGVFANRGDSSSTAVAVPLVSLRLGHARVLTPPRGVIHYARAASLPTGEGFGLCVALICAPPHNQVAHFSNLLPLAENSVAFSSGRRWHP